MIIFQIVQKQYSIIGISPSNHWTQRKSLKGRIVFVFLLFGYVIVTQFMYIFSNATGLMEYVECICSITASIIITGCFAGIVFRKTKLFGCINIIEKLIDTGCQSPESKAIFLKTIEQVERLSEIVFMAVMKISVQLIMLPKCLVSFGVYFLTDSGNDSFVLPYSLWFPFDVKNPIGYLVAIILEYTITGYEYFTIACTLALGMGAYLIAMSATKEIKRGLNLMNDKTQTNENQSNEFKILFSEYINAHAAIKQVEHDFSDIFQPMFMLLFTWSLLAISAALLMIQMGITHHGNVVPLLLTILSGIFGLALVFISCELGQRLADAFKEIDFTIEQFDWYLFPIDIQRMLTIIITIAQQPVELECFGRITCTREVFKNVIHCAFSYFMVLRQHGE